MWHKSNGDGVLEGEQARLLKMAVAAYVEHMQENGCWDGNSEQANETSENWLTVAQVRRMDHGQRLHMIAFVTHALLDPAILPPTLTAENEATVYQIYQFIEIAVEIEQDYEADTLADFDEEYRAYLKDNRRATAAAFRELGLCSEEDDGQCDKCGWRVLITDNDDADWGELIDILADQVLWDRDWEMDDFLGDAPPIPAAALKRAAAIDDGYFSTPAESPPVDGVSQAKAYLESIRSEMRQSPYV